MSAVAKVRDAAGPDASALAATLARAFYDDPVWMWMLPDDRTRIARLTRIYGLLARHAHLPHGGSEVAGRDGDLIEAAALWDPPDRWRLPLLLQARQAPGFVRGFGTRLPAAMRALAAVEKVHPAEPHWYLAYLGTDPAAQGAGLGGALMVSRVERCDQERMPAYLESSKESNVPFYERYGFRVTAELKLPGSCPPVWTMWRDPA